MVVVTLLWSIAGVVTRHLDSARSFEVTFWRSSFNAIALTLDLSLLRGGALWRGLLRAPASVWISAICWAVMFTAFMLALTLTSVANVLVTMACGPLLTALFARLFLRHRLPARTWVAIVIAGCGIGWMFGSAALIGAVPVDTHAAGIPAAGTTLLGTVVAMGVPLAAAINWTVLQHIGHGASDPDEAPPQDMLPAVLLGALLTALATFPAAYPFRASMHDLGLLALLGVVQLALPCLLVVRLTRELPAPEIALLGLLEVLFGVTWAWIFVGETPSAATLAGGALVLSSLVGNEALALREKRAWTTATARGT